MKYEFSINCKVEIGASNYEIAKNVLDNFFTNLNVNSPEMKLLNCDSDLKKVFNENGDFTELDQYFEGTEWCSECNQEFDFAFNPIRQRFIKCTHCGTNQHPCSLCDCKRVNNGCYQAILLELKKWNEPTEN